MLVSSKLPITLFFGVPGFQNSGFKSVHIDGFLRQDFCNNGVLLVEVRLGFRGSISAF